MGGTSDLGSLRLKIEMPLTGLALSFQNAKRMVGDFSSLVSKDVEKVKGSFSSLGAGIAGMGLGLLAKSFIDAAVKMDSMNRSLAVTEGNAEKAKKRMAEFIQVAKLPGLSLENITSAYTKLKQVDINGELAMRTIKGLGNAIVAFGGGTDSMERVVRQLVQMQGKGKVMAEDLMVIAESLPNIRKLMTQAFGTADTEALQKRGVTGGQFIAEITKELEKMPKSADAARNTFDNFADSMFQFKAAMAESVLPSVTAVIGKLTSLMDTFKTLPEPIRHLIGGGAVVGIGGVAGLAGIGFAITQIGTAIPNTVKMVKALQSAFETLYLTVLMKPGLAKLLGIGLTATTVVAPLALSLVPLQGENAKDTEKASKAYEHTIVRLRSALEKIQDPVKLQNLQLGDVKNLAYIKQYVGELEKQNKLKDIDISNSANAVVLLNQLQTGYNKFVDSLSKAPEVPPKPNTKNLKEWTALEDEFKKITDITGTAFGMSDTQQMAWWQAKLKLPLTRKGTFWAVTPTHTPPCTARARPGRRERVI